MFDRRFTRRELMFISEATPSEVQGMQKGTYITPRRIGAGRSTPLEFTFLDVVIAHIFHQDRPNQRIRMLFHEKISARFAELSAHLDCLPESTVLIGAYDETPYPCSFKWLETMEELVAHPGEELNRLSLLRGGRVFTCKTNYLLLGKAIWYVQRIVTALDAERW